jgi:hypothetical protein
MKMSAADIVERAVDAALEQRERGFNRVAVNPARSRVLARAMICHVVLSDWALDHMASIDYRTISHKVRIGSDVLAQNAGQIVRCNVGCYERANVAASLDERNYRRLASLKPTLLWALPFCLLRGFPPT